MNQSNSQKRQRNLRKKKKSVKRRETPSDCATGSSVMVFPLGNIWNTEKRKPSVVKICKNKPQKAFIGKLGTP